jgi:hypothetical protein
MTNYKPGDILYRAMRKRELLEWEKNGKIPAVTSFTTVKSVARSWFQIQDSQYDDAIIIQIKPNGPRIEKSWDRVVKLNSRSPSKGGGFLDSYEVRFDIDLTIGDVKIIKK